MLVATKPERFRRGIWYLVLLAWAAFAAYEFLGPGSSVQAISYSELQAAIAERRVVDVAVSPTLVRGHLRPGPGADPVSFSAVRVDDPDLLRTLNGAGIKVSGVVEGTSIWTSLGWLVPLLIFAFLVWPLLQRGGGGAGLFAAGRSRPRVYVETGIETRFTDVAGVDEAKEELKEVIEFLKTPEKFRRLGGKIPKGILLVGPPGTGKTLLARAVAGEAGVPFFSISGSEFVEMFVGVGAARVRDLFLQARARAPCIVFIDELDALGKVRGVGPMAHEEREQTLNQLLVERDGFDQRVGVILMSATNRPEILDPALLRAGRFDRHVLVDRPDKAGRLAILQVHARGVALEDPGALEVVAGMTAGLVGADLANVVNEAALLAVRREAGAVALRDLQEAVERIVAGLEKKNRVLNRMEKERVAHHEVGHALLAHSLPGQDQVQKISIIPRGIAALGYTLQLPTEDRFLMTERELLDKICVLLGGRVAEEIAFGDVSTGAQDDLVKATDIARSMVRSYGMSQALGPLSFERGGRPLFLGAPEAPVRPDVSEEVLRQIDTEVRRIVETEHARAQRLLEERSALLAEAARALLERETLSGEELREIAARAGATARPPLRSPASQEG